MRSYASLSACGRAGNANTADYTGTLAAAVLHIEHITPRQHGGDDNADNLAGSCCPACNLHKGPNLTGIDPHTGDGRASCSILAAIGGSTILRMRGSTSLELLRWKVERPSPLLEMNDPERRRIRELIAQIQQ